jgi:hypothetical protein
MEKTSEKSFQVFQPRLQTLLRSVQDLAFPRSWGALVNFPSRFFPGWVNIQQIAQRRWIQRLPGVITAAVLLCVFMSLFGIRKAELVLASIVALAGLASFIVMEGIR